ncbi:thioesterase domain-containing protein [Thalassococcus sp. BH17M4-6]|uniref:thioesterase domain-containing protein n=1 Tax=Thalassococcus sp. BH17M4-6 TaxID=3413148 RepID=UPI003BCFE30E
MLTRLKTDRTSPRHVLFMPTHAGNIFPYLPIASQITGASASGVENRYGDASIAEQASGLARDLRDTLPKGAEVICAGWSFGGTLAYEVASALSEAGLRGVSAVLIDAPVAGPDNRAEPFLAIDDRFCEFFVDKAGFEMKPYPSLRTLKDALQAVDPRLTDDLVDQLYLRYALNQARWLRYAPSPGNVPVLQLRAVQSDWPDQNFRAWEAACTRYGQRRTPGDHYSAIAGKNAAAIAAVLSEDACALATQH